MAYVGSVQSSLDLYDENNRKRIDAATRGIGRLVDADMEVTAVKLRALETQRHGDRSETKTASSNSSN